jgi:hypothetical protein
LLCSHALGKPKGPAEQVQAQAVPVVRAIASTKVTRKMILDIELCLAKNATMKVEGLAIEQ